MKIIEINNLGKQFKDTWVLKNVSVSFEEGKVYGLVGRNGSGKTMLLRMICGLAIPSEGSVIIEGKKLGIDIDIPDSVGAIIEVPGFLLSKSGVNNLKYLADLNGIIGLTEIREAMRKCGLDPDNKKSVGKYSLGMRQRLGIAQAIMEDPQILVLDEPMNGLDNQGVEDVKRLLKELKRMGKLIIIASHHMEDITELCDLVYTMDAGYLKSMEI